MRLLRQLSLFMGTLFFLYGGTIQPVQGAGVKTYRVYMILFNGKGECERGFTAYFRRKNINVDYIIRDCGGDFKRCPLQNYVQEIRTLKPDLVYTWGTPITQAIAGKIGEVDPAKHITDIPIVAVPIANPSGSKLADGVDVPTGRNLLGTSQMMSVEEQLSAMRLYRKDVKKIGAIYTPFEENIVSFMKAFEKAMPKHGISFIAYPIPLLENGQMDKDAVGPLIDKLAKEGIDYLYLGPDTAILAFADIILNKVRAHKIPTFASSELTVKTLKPMFGFYSRFYHVGELAASMAESVLKWQESKGKEAKDPYPADLFRFKTLKYMSFTLNIGEAFIVGLYPPVEMLKYAEIVGTAPSSTSIKQQEGKEAEEKKTVES